MLTVQDGESVVTAHEVKGKVDYNKLVEKFGCSLIAETLVERIERVTGVPAHPFLKRGVFYAHRDLDKIVDLYEAGKKFYLYTGAHRTVSTAYLRVQDALHVRSLVHLPCAQSSLHEGQDHTHNMRTTRH